MGSQSGVEPAQMSSEAIVSMAVSERIRIHRCPFNTSSRLLTQLRNAPRSRLARHPKARTIVIIARLLQTLVLHLPLWALQYSLTRNRPRRDWTLGRCLRVRWSRSLCELVAKCELDTLGRDLSKDLDTSKLEYSHPVTLDPAPAIYLRGYVSDRLDDLHASRGQWIPHLLRRVHVRAKDVWGKWNPEIVAGEEKNRSYGFEPVKAFWFQGKKASPAEPRRPVRPGESVMLHFHGGGYLCGTAAETDLTSSICKKLASSSPVDHVLSVDYRLAPTAPWPLPLLDAISAYHHLVHDEGVAEQDIILVGDSAGGHLALALARFIRDEGQALGLEGPKGLVLMSPWADVGFSNAWDEEGRKHNALSDTIDDSFGPFATSLLTRALPVSAMHHDPYLSPASLLIAPSPSGPTSFERFPPTYIIYGEAERISNSIQTLWSRLKIARKSEALRGATQPVQDCITGYDGAVHDFMIFPWMDVEASQAYEDLNVWLKELISMDGAAGLLANTSTAVRMAREPSADSSTDFGSGSGDDETLVDWAEVIRERKCV